MISSRCVRGIVRGLGPYLMLAIALPGGFPLAALLLCCRHFATAGDRGHRGKDVALRDCTACRARLSITSDSERQQFFGQLHELLQTPGASDRSMRSNARRVSGDRRIAQDAVASINRKGFLQRFPDAGRISIRG